MYRRAILCVVAGIFVYSRSYTLDLKARILSETTVEKAVPLLGGNIEQALEQTTELAVKNSGTKVIAHRGYSSEAPENTLPAYELAAQSGAWGIEADIHRTADGAFVCMHDPTVDRMTDGTGVIAEMTLDEIQMLTIDSGSNSWAYPYAWVPTMEEFLEVCQQSGANAVLDLKFTSSRRYYFALQKIQELGMEDSVVCLIGSLDQLKKIRECSEIIRIKYLVEDGTQGNNRPNGRIVPQWDCKDPESAIYGSLCKDKESVSTSGHTMKAGKSKSGPIRD